MQILDIDWGNTRLKWRLTRDGELLEEGGGNAPLNEQLQALLSGFGACERCRVATVRDDASNQTLADAITACYGITAEFATIGTSSCGLTNSYATPKAMGVDRWCAMVALWSELSQAFCLVSFGTAVTIDSVDATGQHVGGYITPGVRMQLQAINAGTGRISIDTDAPIPSDLSPADNTPDAVQRGVVASVAAFTRDRYEAFNDTQPQTVPLVLAGGDADALLPHLSLPCTVRQGLVLDGLARLLP